MARPKRIKNSRRFMTFVPYVMDDSEARSEKAMVDQAFQSAREEGEKEARERGQFFKL